MYVAWPHCGQEADDAVIDGDDCRLVIQFASLREIQPMSLLLR
jgi:hypothetical protein